MNVHSLKNYISSNTDLIELILDKAGFYYISDDFSGGMEYRCARHEEGNPTAVRVNKETLSANCFSTNLKGDIITLIQDKKMLSFPKTVQWIADVVKFKDVDEEEYDLPFGGFYKKIQRFREDNGIELETYDESILNQYEICPNKMFVEDGISTSVQYKYKIGYDVFTDRIVIPWYTVSGELCGIMGRLNKREVESNDNKYFPIINFPKSKTLYGFSENYRNIQDKNMLFILESEKGTLQLDSMGIPLGISLGGSNISQYQSNNIKSLFSKRIIIALDEGLEKEHYHHMAEQLKMNTYFKNNVGYIYDEHGLILPKGSKMSPSDLPKEDFSKLIKNHVKWI